MTTDDVITDSNASLSGIQPVFPEELPETYSAVLKLHKQCIAKKVIIIILLTPSVSY